LHENKKERVEGKVEEKVEWMINIGRRRERERREGGGGAPALSSRALLTGLRDPSLQQQPLNESQLQHPKNVIKPNEDI